MFDRKAKQRSRPGRAFLKTLERVCDMVQSLAHAKAEWSEVAAKIGNATKLPLKSGSVDAVVTHPPYIGSIPYAEYGVLSLVWLGEDPKELDQMLTGGRRQAPDVVERFRNGYAAMLRESHRVLKPGRYLFVMVGNPVVKTELVDLAAMTQELAEDIGFQLVAAGSRNGVNRRANKMGEERLMFFGRN